MTAKNRASSSLSSPNWVDKCSWASFGCEGMLHRPIDEASTPLAGKMAARMTLVGAAEPFS